MRRLFRVERWPCECGSRDASWHGPEGGLRVYCCDDCYEARPITPPGLRKRPGVEYGCERATCTICYEPIDGGPIG